MNRDDEAKILDHDYDGIQEYDNPLPRWWTWLFWGTVFFSIPYWMYYTIGVGETLDQAYEAETAAFYASLVERLGDIEPDESTILRLSLDAGFMTTGRSLFRANCAVCHGQDGGGGTGPNLTDDSYLHVKKLEDIYRVLHDGVESKGMPSWSRLGTPQLVVLSAYVAGLRGSSPAAPLPPQGDRIPPWPSPSLDPAPPAPGVPAPGSSRGE